MAADLRCEFLRVRAIFESTDGWDEWLVLSDSWLVEFHSTVFLGEV